MYLEEDRLVLTATPLFAFESDDQNRKSGTWTTKSGSTNSLTFNHGILTDATGSGNDEWVNNPFTCKSTVRYGKVANDYLGCT